MQSFKTAVFQLIKKHCKLKEHSVFTNAKNLLNDSIKCNSYFQKLFYIFLQNFNFLKLEIKQDVNFIGMIIKINIHKINVRKKEDIL